MRIFSLFLKDFYNNWHYAVRFDAFLEYRAEPDRAIGVARAQVRIPSFTIPNNHMSQGSQAPMKLWFYILNLPFPLCPLFAKKSLMEK